MGGKRDIFICTLQNEISNTKQPCKQKTNPNLTKIQTKHFTNAPFVPNASKAHKYAQFFLYIFENVMQNFLNLIKNTICKQKTNKPASKGCRKLVVMLKIPLQCLYENLTQNLLWM